MSVRDRLAAVTITAAAFCAVLGMILLTDEWLSFSAAVGAGLLMAALCFVTVGLGLGTDEGEG